MNIRPMKQVFIVRADLKMRSGKVGAQCAHAVALYYRALRDNHGVMREFNNDLEEEWFNKNGQRKIVLAVNNEEDLLEAHRLAAERYLTTFLIQDSGKTEFHGNPTHTVISIGPDYDDKIDPLFGKECEWSKTGRLRPY